MTEADHESFVDRQKDKIVEAMGPLVLSAGLYGHQVHSHALIPSVNQNDELYAHQTSILNESRLKDERLDHINALAALFIVRRVVLTRDMLSQTARPKHYNSKSLGYLQDYHLVLRVLPRTKPVVIPSHFSVMPALDWAATRLGAFPILSHQLNSLKDEYPSIAVDNQDDVN
jgi:hypothetical protein